MPGLKITLHHFRRFLESHSEETVQLDELPISVAQGPDTYPIEGGTDIETFERLLKLPQLQINAEAIAKLRAEGVFEPG